MVETSFMIVLKLMLDRWITTGESRQGVLLWFLVDSGLTNSLLLLIEFLRTFCEGRLLTIRSCVRRRGKYNFLSPSISDV